MNGVVGVDVCGSGGVSVWVTVDGVGVYTCADTCAMLAGPCALLARPGVGVGGLCGGGGGGGCVCVWLCACM